MLSHLGLFLFFWSMVWHTHAVFVLIRLIFSVAQLSPVGHLSWFPLADEGHETQLKALEKQLSAVSGVWSVVTVISQLFGSTNQNMNTKEKWNTVYFLLGDFLFPLFPTDWTVFRHLSQHRAWWKHEKCQIHFIKCNTAHAESSAVYFPLEYIVSRVLLYFNTPPSIWQIWHVCNINSKFEVMLPVNTTKSSHRVSIKGYFNVRQRSNFVSTVRSCFNAIMPPCTKPAPRKSWALKQLWIGNGSSISASRGNVSTIIDNNRQLSSP